MAKLYFYYSTMNAGKSTVLLQSSHNYRERGMDTLLYTAKIDDRYAVGTIASRIGLESQAFVFDEAFDFLVDVKQQLENNQKIRCVFVDEAQFLSKAHVKQLSAVTIDLNLPVLCYGLRSDFLGECFEGSKYLLAWADILTEIKTICHCGAKATMVMRLDNQGNAVRSGNQVEIGGNDKYVSVCRKHFMLGQTHS
jgi:thymidine kinase